MGSLTSHNPIGLRPVKGIALLLTLILICFKEEKGHGIRRQTLLDSFLCLSKDNLKRITEIDISDCELLILLPWKESRPYPIMFILIKRDFIFPLLIRLLNAKRN
jgi:hypothetical protein